jgi:hypothetical protein
MPITGPRLTMRYCIVTDGLWPPRPCPRNPNNFRAAQAAWRRWMQRQNSSAKTGLPAIREVRTNLGLWHPRLRGADRPPRPRPALVPCGHEDISGNTRTPDKSRASTSLAKQAISGSPPAPVTSATSTFPATDEARTHLGPSQTSRTDGLRAHDPLRSLSATATLSANRRGPDTLRAYGPHRSTIGGSQITVARCCHRCRPRQI